MFKIIANYKSVICRHIYLNGIKISVIKANLHFQYLQQTKYTLLQRQ